MRLLVFFKRGRGVGCVRGCNMVEKKIHLLRWLVICSNKRKGGWIFEG